MVAFGVLRFCIDNGAMIAYAGLLHYCSSGHAPDAFSIDNATVRQRYCLHDAMQCRYRTDEVDIPWRS